MKSLAALITLSLTLSANAQTPFLVADLNSTVSQGALSSSPDNFQVIGDTLYFRALLQSYLGYELWKYKDGQASRVLSHADSPGLRVDLGDGTFLVVGGGEILRTDGTDTGTNVVKSIAVSGYSYELFHNKLFFIGNDGVHGGEPWVSDGTSDGTQMVADLDGTPAASVTSWTVNGDKVFLFGTGKLWTSDGTAAGTQLVTTGLGAVFASRTVGANVYFVANGDLSNGRELWETDGTAEGTHLVADIAPGPTNGIRNFGMASVGNTLYFFASSTGTTVDLWKTDGTAAGTQFVAALNPRNDVAASLTVAGGLLYAAVDYHLWSHDPASGLTSLLDDHLMYNLVTPAFGRVYYVGAGGQPGGQVKSTDGHSTAVIYDFSQYPGPALLYFTGGKLYFSASDNLHGIEPWVCEDGTASTVHMLVNVAADPPPSSNPQMLTGAGNLAFFIANDGTHGFQMWRTDGTSDGTIRLTSAASDISLPASFTPVGNALYFLTGSTLGRSDGSLAGTAAVKTFSEGAPSILPARSSLYLSVPGVPSHLWRSDGTVAGTFDVGIESPSAIAEAAGRAFVRTSTGIYATDGTPQSTERIVHLRSSDSSKQIATSRGEIFYTDWTADAGGELWHTDGSIGNETLLKDIAAGDATSNPQQLTDAGRYLFFVANDGVTGAELWRTDGTPDGTILVKDIRPGTAGSDIRSIVSGNGRVFFVADDGVHGAELWTSDGTADGTRMVSDVKAGVASSNPNSLIFARGIAWFSADDGTHGVELWKADENGATMVADIVSGPASSFPFAMAEAGDFLFFQARTPETGAELWALPFDVPALSIDDSRVVEGTGGTNNILLRVRRTGSTSGTCAVAFTTMDGTAKSGSDYAEQSGTITFAPGDVAKTISIPVITDSDVEKNESFFVRLDSPVGATIERSTAVAIIENDDSQVDLSIQIVPSAPSGRSAAIRITNAGPSTATAIRVHYSLSPFFFFTLSLLGSGGCTSSSNPMDCVLGDPLPAGTSRTFTLGSLAGAGDFDSAKRPGMTITADVAAAETDSDLSNNRSSVLMSTDGGLLLPPFLESGTAARGIFQELFTNNFETYFTLTASNANVVVPATTIVPAGNASMGFDIAGGGGTGPAVITADNHSVIPSVVTIQVVTPGSKPKFDVTMRVSSSVILLYGQDYVATVNVDARLHDGTRPTGLVDLIDTASGNTVLQQTLDGNATTTFRYANLHTGYTAFRVHYEGDANFNPLDSASRSVSVSGTSVDLVLVAPVIVCAAAQQTIRLLATAAGTDPPVGEVAVSVNGNNIGSFTLQPTGRRGEAAATFQYTFYRSDEAHSLIATYSGVGAFNPGYASAAVYAGPCASTPVTATGSRSSVSVSWNAVPGAANYAIIRWAFRVGPSFVGASSGTTFVDTNQIEANKIYLYSVRALDASGNTLAYGVPDLASTFSFLDDPLTAGTTRIKFNHLGQLYQAADALKALATSNTAPVTWSYTNIVRASDVTDLRARLNGYRIQLGLPPIVFTDPDLGPGTVIKAAHVQELRDSLK